MRYVKDPATGKRVSRMNPREQWQTVEVPGLAIIDHALWERVQARLAGIRQKSGADKPDRPQFWQQRRAMHLLSGKLFCGGCGGVMANAGKDYLACNTARKQGLCDNRAGIRRGEVERVILDALRNRLMAPELVAEFCAEFTTEWNRLAGERSAQRGAKEQDLAKVVRKLAHLIDAIADGLRGGQLQAEMDRLEARKAALEAELAAPAGTVPLLHPALAEVYRIKVAELAEALRCDNNREALEAARGLIERVTLHPRPEGGFEIELVGAIAAMVRLGLDGNAKGQQRATAAGADLFASSVMVVAGAGFEPATFRL
jgi:hypothetical protein